jgi:hypothetical protein
MPFRSGDVIRVFDRWTRPKKWKLHICICPQRNLFLRINSDPPAFGPAHPLSSADCRFLHHDSFVELQTLVWHSADDLANAEDLGRLSRKSRSDLADSAGQAVTLTDDQKTLIRSRLLEETVD